MFDLRHTVRKALQQIEQNFRVVVFFLDYFNPSSINQLAIQNQRSTQIEDSTSHTFYKPIDTRTAQIVATAICFFMPAAAVAPLLTLDSHIIPIDQITVATPLHFTIPETTESQKRKFTFGDLRPIYLGIVDGLLDKTKALKTAEVNIISVGLKQNKLEVIKVSSSSDILTGIPVNKEEPNGPSLKIVRGKFQGEDIGIVFAASQINGIDPTIDERTGLIRYDFNDLSSLLIPPVIPFYDGQERTAQTFFSQLDQDSGLLFIHTNDPSITDPKVLSAIQWYPIGRIVNTKEASLFTALIAPSSDPLVDGKMVFAPIKPEELGTRQKPPQSEFIADIRSIPEADQEFYVDGYKAAVESKYKGRIEDVADYNIDGHHILIISQLLGISITNENIANLKTDLKRAGIPLTSHHIVLLRPHELFETDFTNKTIFTTKIDGPSMLSQLDGKEPMITYVNPLTTIDGANIVIMYLNSDGKAYTDKERGLFMLKNSITVGTVMLVKQTEFLIDANRNNNSIVAYNKGYNANSVVDSLINADGSVNYFFDIVLQ
ncbi:MAG: hypothetical protein KF716_20060 [Anaerolineae bacterium]|nr:hypothetical protein [Anaerolineae bacterium]